ncbi:retrovirus-related pol polyprotein from transposon TNT 1-94 [Tanacetum coccineum]|uniref:Retrovirus-related pol polyprotein from transposon TNT 1-94 n=1 Tax=Tanacetum coccineum TaxID=301880 RepID=A0ABQ4X918_9ASTR
MEAEVDQNAVEKKSAEIERKNLLTKNENLIVDCLSKEVFYTATNFVLTVSRFSKMHEAYTVAQACCLELEVELSKLKHKIQKDDHNEMIKHFSYLEMDHLNLQLKYQILKERFGNNKSQPSQDAPEFDTVFEINKMKASLQGKDNAIKKLREQISQMKERRSEADRILDFKAIYFSNIELTKKVIVLQEQNALFRAENEKVKQHCKELYDSIKIMRAKTIEKTMLTPGMYAIDVEPIPPLDRNNKEVYLDYLKHLKESVETLHEIVEEARIEKPLDNALRNACFYTKRSQELLEYVIGTCLTDFNKRDKKIATTPLIRKKQVVQIVLWYLDSGCSKHMTGNRSRLKNFVKKFIRTVRFGNNHFGAIMGYGDYVIGDSVISRCIQTTFVDMLEDVDGVEWNLKNKSWLWHRRLNHLNFGTINDLARKDLVRGLPRLKFEKDHLCSSCQLGKSKKYTHKPKSENTIMEVLHTLHMDLCGSMRVQSINGKKYILVIVDDYSRFTWVKFLRSKDETLEFVIKFLKQIQVSLNKTVRYIRTDNDTEFNDVVKRQNRTLVEAARTMLLFSKAPMFLWAEVVATAFVPKTDPSFILVT